MTDDELKDRLDRIHEAVTEVREDVRTLRHIVVEGNGSPPLTVSIARNTERIDALEPLVEKAVRAADEGRFDRKSKGAIIVALLALLGALGVPLLQHLLG